MNLPSDPIMLVSIINTKLRDVYSTLDALCEDLNLNLNQNELEAKLHEAGFDYMPEINQFR